VDPGPNECGGCRLLAAPLGRACGSCGQIVCNGNEDVTCSDHPCADPTPVCLRAACVSCQPGSRRCGSSASVEVGDAFAVWTPPPPCPAPAQPPPAPPGAACLSVSLTDPPADSSRALLPQVPFRWILIGRLSGVRYCTVLVLDKGQDPLDGFGEDAFYL